MTQEKTGVSARDFFSAVERAVPKKALQDFYKTQTRDYYYFDYKPGFPNKTNGDFCVAYDIFNGTAKMYGNLLASIPTIREFCCLIDLCDCLRFMEVC